MCEEIGLVNEPINPYNVNNMSNFDLLILKTIMRRPGLGTLDILRIVKGYDDSVTETNIKHSIKTKLYEYVEYKGTAETGGYYLIKQ